MKNINSNQIITKELIEGNSLDENNTNMNQYYYIPQSLDFLVKKQDLIWKNGTGKKFLRGNCIKEESQCEFLLKLQQDGIKLWLEHDKFCLKVQENHIQKLDQHMLGKILSAKYSKVITIGYEKNDAIKIQDLLHVDRVVFDPYKNAEFYILDDLVHRNIFKPTRYMELDASTMMKKELKAIIKLFKNLYTSDERLEYFINMLAYFFQNLKKPPVAILLKGPQGAGKGILFDEILIPLFGKAQCFQINDKTIRGNFIGGMIENKLIINFDEISANIKDNSTLKNTIKMLISNQQGSFEKKYVNTEEETPLFSLSLFTSNALAPVEIEHNDRRFSVFDTLGNLSKVDHLGYGSYDALIQAIREELEDFAIMLLTYQVDVKKATTVMNTPEKEALVGITTDRFENFLKAIKEKNLEYFIDLQSVPHTSPYYLNLKTSFLENRISRKTLKEVFCAIESEDISTKKLIKRLTALDVNFFLRRIR